METITIPKKFSQKGDLIVIPKSEYKNLLRRETRRVSKLDRGIAKSFKEIAQGKLVGPFSSVSALKKSLSQ